MAFKALACRHVLGSLIVASTSVAMALGMWSIKNNTWHKVLQGNRQWTLAVAVNAAFLAVEVCQYACRMVWPRQYPVLIDLFFAPVFGALSLAAAESVRFDWRQTSNSYCNHNGETYRLYLDDKTYEITGKMCSTMKGLSISMYIPLGLAVLTCFLALLVIHHRGRAVQSRPSVFKVTWVAPLPDSDLESIAESAASESRDSLSVFKESL